MSARHSAQHSAQHSTRNQAPKKRSSKRVKEKKPIYKRVWFWVLIVLLAIGIFGASSDEESEEDAASSTQVVSSEDGSISSTSGSESTESSSGESESSEASSSQQDDADDSEEATAAATGSTVTVSGDLTVHFIDVGQGDSIFIEFPDGTCMLIDAGTASAGSTVVSYVKALGYTRIDYLVATHPHADHIGGMEAVIAAFEIGEVWAPEVTTDTATFEGFLDAVEAAGLEINVAESAETILSSSGLSVTLLGPSASESSSDLNEYSAIVYLVYGSTSFLFTGDASAETIPSVDVDVLKVSHHGSSTGTTSSLVAALSPSIAVISYGIGNSYGHPTQTVLNALAAVGAAVYGTGANGTVVVTSDGTNLSVSVEASGTVVAASEDAGGSSSSGSSSSGSSSSGSSSSDSSSSGSSSSESSSSDSSTEEAASSGTSSDDSSADASSSGSTTESESESTESTDEGSSQTVYVTATGTKYHTASCRYVSGKDDITAMTEEEAIAAGYDACSVCNP